LNNSRQVKESESLKKYTARKVKEYQRLLHLQHWQIDLDIVPDATIDGNYGQIATNSALERARISIHDPTYSGNFLFEETPRTNILHEMLELLLVDVQLDLKLGSKSKPQKERLIERIVKAITTLEDKNESQKCK